MKINYWQCKFENYDELWDEKNEIQVYIYGCTHPGNKEQYCSCDNKWVDRQAECSLLQTFDQIANLKITHENNPPTK